MMLTVLLLLGLTVAILADNSAVARAHELAVVPVANRVSAMAQVLVALQRAVARGSTFYNSGRPDLCAQLYAQTCVQIAAVLDGLDQPEAALYMRQTVETAVQTADPRSAAWGMRHNMDTLYRSIMSSDAYAALSRRQESPEEAFIGMFIEAIAVVQQEPDAGCAYGLLITEGPNGATIVEARAAEGCNQELEDSDAVFFVASSEDIDESSSSSSSSSGNVVPASYEPAMVNEGAVDLQKLVAEAQQLEEEYAYEVEYYNEQQPGEEEAVQAYELGEPAADYDELPVGGMLNVDTPVDVDALARAHADAGDFAEEDTFNNAPRRQPLLKLKINKPKEGAHHHAHSKKKCHFFGAFMVIALVSFCCVAVVRRRRQKKRAQRKGLRIVYGVEPPADVYPFAMNAQTLNV